MIQSSLKQRIASGEQIIGANISMTHCKDELKKIVESGNFDFLWIDSQHSPFNEELLVSFCAKAADLNAPVIFRIKHTFQSYLIGNLLDLGPAGIEVPQVESETTVNEAIDYFYYPQKGKRSWGGSARYKIREQGEDRLHYADWWNNIGILMLQLESIPAVNKAHQLAKAGVDCLSFGPNDLWYSLEAHPHHPFQNVDDCVQNVVEQLEHSNTKVCFRNYSSATRGKYLDMGVTVFLENPKD